MPTIPYRSFAAGEVSPRLGARVDQVKYQTGAHTMRNFLPTLEGAAQNRSGLGYVQSAWATASDDPIRLIPFVVSDDEAYVVVMRPSRLTFIRNGTPVFEASLTISNIVEAGTEITVTTALAHGMTDGQELWIDGVLGATQLNRRFFQADVTGANTFVLQLNGADVDPTEVSAYISGGTVSPVRQVSCSWDADDIPRIRYSQSKTTMVVTVDARPVFRLQSLGSGLFSVTAATFGPTIAAPTVGTAAGTAGAVTVRYQVTAVDSATLEESYPCRDALVDIANIDYTDAVPVTITTTGAHGYATGDRVKITDVTTSPWSGINNQSFYITVTGATTFTLNVNGTIGIGPTGLATEGNARRNAITNAALTFPTSSANKVTVSWTAIDGALEYNIYREINGIFAYCGTSASTSFEDLGYSLVVSTTPPLERDVFAAAGDYPLAVAFFQQRLLLGGSLNDQEKTFAGRIAQVYNFAASNPTQADDSFSWVVRSEKTQAIRHILEMSRCMVFTQSAIFTLEGDDAGALTPSAVNPRKRAEHGLGDIPPIAIGNAILYVQSTGSEVNEILPGSGEDFNSKELTVYSRHLFDGNTVVAWSYAQSPSSILWCARDDGTFLSLVYLREHDIWGWTPHTTGDGDDSVVSVASVPENGESVTYFAVLRRIGGYDVPYIERMASRRVFHACDGRFLDSYRFYQDENEDGTAYLFLHYDDAATGTDTWYLLRDGTAAAFVAGDVGRVFLLEVGTAPRVNRFWCTVQSFVDADHVTVSVRTDLAGCINRSTGVPNPEDTEPTEEEPDLIPFPYNVVDGFGGSWSQSITEVTDLWHLEGREVYAVVDGFPQGPFTVDNGTVTLSEPGVLVVIGLRIDALLSTLEPENPEGETWADVTKTVGTITVRVERTAGLEVGTSVARLNAWDNTWRESQLFDEGALYTGRLTTTNLAQQTAHGRVYVRQRSGLPTNVLGIYPQIEAGEK